MTIYEYAKKMEKDGEKFYRDMAGKTKNTGLQQILNLLADDEVKHYQVIEKMEKNSTADLRDTDVLKKSKNIFEKMKDNAEQIINENEQLELYEKAQKIEKESENFYNEKANEIQNSRQKEIFLKLAQEESKHFFLLENLTLLIRRPKDWVENGEFVHLDEY